MEKVVSKLKTLNMSAYRLSRLSGVSEPTISRWLSGKRDIKLKTANKIFAVLGLELKDLHEQR